MKVIIKPSNRSIEAELKTEKKRARDGNKNEINSIKYDIRMEKHTGPMVGIWNSICLTSSMIMTYILFFFFHLRDCDRFSKLFVCSMGAKKFLLTMWHVKLWINSIDKKLNKNRCFIFSFTKWENFRLIICLVEAVCLNVLFIVLIFPLK